MPQLSFPEKGSYIGEFQHETAAGTPKDGHSAPLGVPSRVVFDPKQESRLWRNVDLRLMPMIALIRLSANFGGGSHLLWGQRTGNIGNAKLDGLTTQLNLVGNEYNIALTVFFISFAIFEFPCNDCPDITSLVMQFVSPSKWLAGIMIFWGIVIREQCEVRATFAYDASDILNWLLYAFVSALQKVAFIQGLHTMLTFWKGAFSGLLAYGINFMNGLGGLQGWSWIFILEGLATVLVGFVALIVMVDYPSSAGFLTPEEQQFIIQRRGSYLNCALIYPDFSEIDEEGDMGTQVRAAVTDWQVWALSLIQMSTLAPLYGITYFLPTSTTQLLSIPPYVLGGINFTAYLVMVLGVFAYFSDRKKLRSPFIFAAQLISLIGYIINITNASSGVKYFGTFWCVAGSYTAGTGPIIWAANNLEGKYKRAVGMALVITMGNFGGAIASNIFRTQDAPRYLLGFGIEIMFTTMGMLIIPIVALTYKRLNARKDELERQKEETSGVGGEGGELNRERLKAFSIHGCSLG
ncbi:major facilitator superfamily domain-containing protein [Scleroderma yunnanense]